MENKYQQSIDRFNEFAKEFEQGFMELSLYDKAIESFKTVFEHNGRLFGTKRV